MRTQYDYVHEQEESKAHQALGASVDDTDEHEADREPCLRVLGVKVTERDRAQLLHSVDTCAAHEGLDAQQKEVHIELSS